MKRFLSLLIWPAVLCFSPNHSYAQTTLVLNEIMINPTDGQLPVFEYIELFNNGGEPIALDNFEILIGANVIALPTFILSPKQYVVLVSHAATTAFESYGNVLPLPTWYALNNTAGTIAIRRDGEIQDLVSYSDAWHTDASKRRGGWSLERINPNIPCDSKLNWNSSRNPMGGTPSRANSILNAIDMPPISVHEWSVEENSVTLSFDMPLDHLRWSNDSFTLDPAGTHPDDVQVSSGEDELVLRFAHNIELNTPIKLKFDEIYWCDRVLQLADLDIFHQGDINFNDVVINEVLFNPKEGGVDFVELYNRSGHAINLQYWQLGNRTISSDMLVISPHQHLALTTSPAVLRTQYPTDEPQFFHQMPSLPSYTNQQGNVVLSVGSLVVDSLYYNAAMHQPFLKDHKGISLERQAPDRSTNEPGNFLSAATISGGATPGHQNSVQSDHPTENNLFFLTSKTVSPDDDSFEDFLEINYNLSSPGYMLNIDIYSDKGTLVNRLIRQQNAGLSGKIIWDCRAENGQLCRPGIYVYHVELYNDKGHRDVEKGAFVVTYMRAHY